MKTIKGEELTHEIESVAESITGNIFLIKTYSVNIVKELQSVILLDGIGETVTFTDFCCGETSHGEMKMELEEIFDLIEKHPDDFQVSEIMEEN